MDLPGQRMRMVEQQIAARGIRDPRVLEAMRTVPREMFVSEPWRHLAYTDAPLPIEEGQTISQPYIVALMIDAAGVDSSDRVLEVGAGSGYASAVMSRVAQEVFAIERHAALAALAHERLVRIGCTNARVRHGDGTLGWPEHAPFDAIIVSAGGTEVPSPLLEQLRLGGRLIIPIGSASDQQRLLRIRRTAEHDFTQDDLGPVHFVPLIGSDR